MLCSANCVWAQTSKGKVEITESIKANTEGWQYIGNNGIITGAFVKGTADVKNPAGYYVKITSDGFFKLRFAKGTVFAGDVLKVNVGPSGDDSDDLGYIVEGSNTFVNAGNTGTKYTQGQDVNYTLKSSDIQNDPDAENTDMIVINRSGGGYAYAYHSFEITRPDYTVSFYSTDNSLGTVTAKRLDTNADITSGTKVPNGTQVQFTAIPASGCALKQWSNGSKDLTRTLTIEKDVNPSATFERIKVLKTIDVNGTTREYDVYAPNGISGSVGVIISLHGASNDYDNGRVDFNEIADANWNTDNKKFVVVYPRGLMRELRGTERGWDSYTEDGVEDVEFFKAVVNNLNQTFNGQFSIDYNRIYLAGFSNGGMMAYKAAHQAGDFFAACASVAGYPVNESHLFHAGVKPVPFVHIQGNADGVFPDATYPVDVIVHNMVYRNGAEFNPRGDGGMVADNSNVTKDCHNAEAGGAAYYMYKVANMGHTPDYDWTGDSKDDVASTMWAFFNKSGITNNVDPTLKFRIYDATYFWGLAGNLGFDNVNNDTSVLSYGGRTTTGKNQTPYDKDTKNNNLWHSLQFEGGVNGAPHYLKLNVETNEVSTENPNQFFLVKLTKTGETTPVFAKRYQAGRGTKDLYINFSALPDFNEYKLEITKSSSDLVVKVHGVEFHTGKCQDVGKTENPTAFYDVAAVLDGMNPIYQPVYGTSFDGIAREYLPIADIPVGGDPKTIENDLKVNGTAISSLPSTLITDWKGATTATISGQQFLNIAVSGRSDEYTQNKSKNACILIRDDSHSHNYTIDKTKGINISQFGRAEMPEYLNGTRATFPTHGVLAMKFQGTLDFTLLAQNDVTYDSDANAGRRTLKVYYTNDQMDGEFKELKEWWFFNTRSEVYGSDSKGNTLAPLSASIRLPHLGKDGTCTVLITYEGNGRGSSFSHADSDNDKMWIKGFVIKRPDLKVTIGRTDNNYSGQTYGGENNTFCTRFGENKPYIWSFENVGFNNTKNSDLNVKKINEKDWRTYICGGTDDSWDHLLVYSNLDSNDDNDKAQFDGRVAGQEHIEFRAASNYRMKDDPTASDNGRMEFNPILSNGLKLNVTGSGWFKIKCSAPNGPVNMKVYSSTNYGITYTNLLREFRVEKTATDMDWQEYTVYLKGHVNRTATNPKGFWDGTPSASKDEAANAEEIIRMSLYVVYDEISGTTYDEGHPQLNIHQLSWLNEEPADYVFQREEDPKLLTEWQTINRDGNVVLYWKAGNDDDAQYPILKENGQSTYKVTGQITTDIATKGVKSPGGKASVTVPTDAGTYDAYWDISAKPQTNAHTETAYANGKKDFVSANEYKNVSSRGNTEFDIPISGSFIRICAMKNTYVVAHVLPGTVDLTKTGAANGAGADGKSDAAVYVLDETGAPIPYKANGADLDDEANKHGYVSYMQNFDGGKDGGAKSNGGTMRIDFAANAGKEYFICAKDASISLARLEVQDWRYKPTKSSTKLELADNTNNSSTISTAYDTQEFYRDAKLTRSFKANTWASLVLPFSMNEKKFEEVFGVGAKCLHFTEVDKDAKTVYLTHHYYNMIVAGRPVFVLPTKDVSDAEIADITLQAKDVRSTTSNGFEFVPSYDNATISKNDLYLNNANAIKYLSVEKATYPGMRSYIKNKAGYDPSVEGATGGVRAMFLNFNDAEEYATGIEELITKEFGNDVIVVTKSTKVYDLNGRMVTEGKDINSLPAGIYIVNGKKYIVK